MNTTIPNFTAFADNESEREAYEKSVRERISQSPLRAVNATQNEAVELRVSVGDQNTMRGT